MKRYVSTWAPLCALIGISLALISCGKQTSNYEGAPSLNNASVTTTNAFPGVVMVAIPGGGICSGTVISRRAVLTAAHCGVGRNGQYMVRSSVGSFYTSTKVIVGSGVVESTDDMMVLIFDENTFAANLVHSIASNISVGDTATLVGYGCTSLITRTGAGTQRMTQNVVGDINDYVELYTSATSANAINSHAIISGGTCFGDSGGPLFIQEEGAYKLAAVTHAGGISGNTTISQFVNVATNSSNRATLSQINSTYSLGISGI